jgi:type II secretory pathway pseudopilin PulG
MAKVRPYRRRAAVSVLEVVVVVAILGLLVGLLLPAIQRARTAAVRMQSNNNLRQISLATHSYAASSDDRLPYFAYRAPNLFVESAPLVDVLCHVQAYQGYQADPGQWGRYVAAVFQNPADPSFDAITNSNGDSSYVASALVFRKGRTVPTCCPDGLANTIGWTEQYARCGDSGFESGTGGPCGMTIIPGPPFNGEPIFQTSRRHSFADFECNDVYPKTSGGVARPVRDFYQVERVTFQVTPRPQDCFAGVPTASHPSGLAVALMDGSIRTISPGVSPRTFWALVTPDGGEVAGDW